MQNNIDDIDNNSPNSSKPFVTFEDAWAALQPSLDREVDRRAKRKKRIVFFLFSVLIMGFLGKVLITKNSRPLSFSTTFHNKSVSPSIKPINLGSALPISIEQAIITKNKSSKSRMIYNNRENKEVIFAFAKAERSKDLVTSYQKENLVLNVDQVSGKKNLNISFAKNLNIKSQLSPETNQRTNSNNIENSRNENEVVASSNKQPEVQGYSNNLILKWNDLNKKGLTLNDSSNKPVSDTTSLANAKTKLTKQEMKNNFKFYFGVEFGLPIQMRINTMEVNGSNQPLSLLIPLVWGSVKLTNKQTILLSINSNSQYYLNNKVSLNSTKYQATIQHAATINDNPESINYTQLVAINKLMTVQASLLYQYQLSSKLKAGMGIGINFLQGAILENKVIKNNVNVTADNLYGIDRKSKEWELLKASFLNSRIELAYQLKKVDFGLNMLTPISSLTNKGNPSFVNTNVFLRWGIK